MFLPWLLQLFHCFQYSVVLFVVGSLVFGLWFQCQTPLGSNPITSYCSHSLVFGLWCGEFGIIFSAVLHFPFVVNFCESRVIPTQGSHKVQALGKPWPAVLCSPLLMPLGASLRWLMPVKASLVNHLGRRSLVLQLQLLPQRSSPGLTTPTRSFGKLCQNLTRRSHPNRPTRMSELWLTWKVFVHRPLQRWMLRKAPLSWRPKLQMVHGCKHLHRPTFFHVGDQIKCQTYFSRLFLNLQGCNNNQCQPTITWAQWALNLPGRPLHFFFHN